MTPQQAKSIVKQLAGMYRGITQADAQFITRQIKGLPHPLVVRTMDEYRKANPKLDAAAFVKACEEAAKPPPAPAELSNSGTWFDTYRRQIPELRDAGDIEVAVTVHHLWWNRAQRRDSYCRQITNSLRSRLCGLGVVGREADRLVLAAFKSDEDFAAFVVQLREKRTPAEAFA